MGWQHVQLSETGVYLSHAKARLDLGGIVKEFAVDMSVQKLRVLLQNHIVELAGDIYASGTSNNYQPWRIGISDLSDPETSIRTLVLTDVALASSGSYQRFFTHEGKTYSHFLNPKTGEPVEGAISVSWRKTH